MFGYIPIPDPEGGPAGGDGGAAGGAGGEEPPGGAGGEPEGAEGEKPGAEGEKNPRIKELSDENARRRVSEKDAKDQLAAAQARIKEFEDKDKSEIDKATGKVEELTTQITTLSDDNTGLRLENALLKDTSHSWKDLDAVVRMIDLSDVKIEDGDVTGLADALKKLAKDKPYLLEDKEDDGSGEGKPPAGAPPKTKNNQGQTSREALVNKYRALQR